MGISRQEYWSGLPCLPRGDLPNPGIEPISHVSCIAGRFFTTSTTWEVLNVWWKWKLLSHIQFFVTPLVYGILQTRILEQIPLPFSRGSSQPRDRTQISCIASRFFTFLSHKGSLQSMGSQRVRNNWVTKQWQLFSEWWLPSLIKHCLCVGASYMPLIKSFHHLIRVTIVICNEQ